MLVLGLQALYYSLLHMIQEVADFQHYILKRYQGVSYYVEKACTINTTKQEQQAKPTNNFLGFVRSNTIMAFSCSSLRLLSKSGKWKRRRWSVRKH